jgi:protein tyrosine/serine phosphatase
MFKGDLNTPAGRGRAWIDSLFVDHAVFRLVWGNVAVVVPGKLYRCNHPTPGRLARAQRKFGLHTLINLRGQRFCGSEALSREAALRLGMNHIYMAFESRGAPHRERILRFHDIYRGLDTPAMMHCKSGADRAGLASGLALMFEGGTSRDALGQLNWRFGHIDRSPTGILDAFFHLYATVAEGRIPFLQWVAEEYDEVKLRSDFKANGLARFVNDRLLARE